MWLRGRDASQATSDPDTRPCPEAPVLEETPEREHVPSRDTRTQDRGETGRREGAGSQERP